MPRAWNLGVVGGKRYGVPMDTHILGLYYNTELFEKAGLDPNKPPVNHGRVRRRRQEADHGPEPVGRGHPELRRPGPYGTGWRFLAQQGGKMFTDDLKKAAFNDAKGKAAFQFMSDLVHVHKVAPPVMTDINKAFLTKQAAMILIGPWLINSAMRQEGLKFKTAPMPKIFGQFAAWGMSHQLVLGKQPDRAKQLAAMKFMRYMSENSLTWVKGGQAPARRSILTVRRVQGDAALERVHAGDPAGVGVDAEPADQGADQGLHARPGQPLVAAWESIVQKKKTVDQALADAEKGVNAILAEQ